MTKLKQYRKKSTIEVVEYYTDSVKVQNTGDSSDQWHIPLEVFERTYEEIK